MAKIKGLMNPWTNNNWKIPLRPNKAFPIQKYITVSSNSQKKNEKKMKKSERSVWFTALMVSIILVALIFLLCVIPSNAQDSADTLINLRIPVSESPEDSLDIFIEILNYSLDTTKIQLLQKFDYIKAGTYTMSTVIYYSDSLGFCRPTVMIDQYKIDWKAEAASQGVSWRDVWFIVKLWFKK